MQKQFIFSALFDKSEPFIAYSWQHALPNVIIGFVCLLLIMKAKRSSVQTQHIIGFGIALIPAVTVIVRMILVAMEGNFSIQEDLPFHLCRILGLTAPFFFYYKNEKWINACYFLIMAGTIQAILTPDLKYFFPYYEYFTYWLLHATMMFLPIYAIAVFGFRPSISDIKNAFIACNLYLLFTIVLNISLGSNYLFTMRKPKFASLIDVLGPWPWYLLSLEGLALVLFFIVFLPVKWLNK